MEVNDPKDQESRYEYIKRMAQEAIDSVKKAASVEPKPEHEDAEAAAKYLRKTRNRP